MNRAAVLRMRVPLFFCVGRGGKGKNMFGGNFDEGESNLGEKQSSKRIF